MAFQKILSSIFEDFWQQKKEHIRFISVTESMMKTVSSIVSETEDVKIIDLAMNFSPLKPFLQILSDFSPDEKLIESTTYSLQKETFKSFFSYGNAGERNDLIIMEEVFYEKKRYRETIVELLKRLCSGKYIIMNAQYLYDEAIDILKALEETSCKGKFVFLFDSLKNEAASKKTAEYIDSISNQKNFFTLSDDSKSDIYADEISSGYDDLPSYEMLFNGLHNCRLFLALEQSRGICNWLTLNIAKLGLNQLQTRALYMEMGLIDFYSFLPDEAALYLNNVLESQVDDEKNILATIFYAKVLAFKNANAYAAKCAHILTQKLQSNKESPYYALALATEYNITERSDSTASIETYNLALQMMEKHGLINNYINVMLYIPWAFVNDQDKRTIVDPNIDKALELSKKIDNQFALSTACHWKGILISFNDQTDQSLPWYYECNRIRTEIGDLSSIIKIRNGLSYVALIRANYIQSYTLINSFISRIDEINDYTEMIITLKNMSQALFYSRHYKEAYELLKKILHFMHLFDLEDASYSSFLPEYNDILIYKTIIDFFHGDYVRSKINLHNILHNGKSITAIDQPLTNFLQAIIYAQEKNIESSTEAFKMCIERFAQVGKSQEHRLVYMYYEYALVLSHFGYAEYGNHYLKEGFNLAKKKNLSYYTQNKESITCDDYTNAFCEVEPIKINLIYLEEKAEKERLMNQLHNRIHDYQFLNKVMLYGTNPPNIRTYVRNVLQAAFDYSMADAAFIAEKNESGWKILASDIRNDTPLPTSDMWEKFTNESKKSEQSQLVYEKDHQLLFCNISKFEFIGGIIIVPSKANVISTDNINTLNIAVSNIQAQLVMLKQNEHLLYISSTDQLSKLKNRRALQDFIILENEKLGRYRTRRKFTLQETIAFIDLDNFKYYNDTYGHETGDLLITCFSQLLKQIFRKVDFIARFGGDEFVCVLSDTSCTEGKRAAQRLYQGLEERNYFITDIEAFLHRKLEIPKVKRLGFSMGLCSNYDVEDNANLDIVLANADKALYYSKQHGKGCVSSWSEIKESVSKSEEPPCRTGRADLK